MYAMPYNHVPMNYRALLDRTAGPVKTARHRPARSSPTQSANRRIPGIDLARGLAIAGMLAVHVGPTHQHDTATRLYALVTHGRASLLFALLAGLGVSLLAASRTATTRQARLRLLWTAAVLFPLGLGLQALDVTVNVILTSYAALFIIGAACLTLSSRLILTLAALSGILGPLGFLYGRIHDPGTFNRSPVMWNDTPLEMLHGIVLSGPFPLITWATPFFVGVWLGRRELARTSTRLALVIAGGLAAVVAPLAAGWADTHIGPMLPMSWYRLSDTTPHSQMPFWLWGALGSAVFALGACLFLADYLPRLTRPLVTVGQAALSVYAGHLLALHWWREGLIATDVEDALISIVLVLAAAVVLLAVWRRFLNRGPLEAVLVLPWQIGQQTARWKRQPH